MAIRPYEPGDADGIARLREAVYPCRPEAHDVEWHRRLYAWLEASDLADQMSRWVIDAGGDVVGHLAAVPQRYRIAGRSVVAHTPADYMVSSKYGFHAIGLMRTLFRTHDNVVSCDWEPTVQAIE
ncbi:MAG: GNAT family N-acetyltransferase, partial [Chloroflexota bacterium]|nr:GNAT family N-acetyltransferase [Chloroflexota bacterium]